MVTVVDVGTTGLRIQQTDTYVTGQEFYTTDVMITNNGADHGKRCPLSGG